MNLVLHNGAHASLHKKAHATLHKGAHATLHKGAHAALRKAAVQTTTPAPSRFTIEVTDKNGVPIPRVNNRDNPFAREARGIVYDIHIPNTPQDVGGSIEDDMEMERELCRIEHALNELYPEGAASEEKFRPQFVRLFFLAQLSLEGDIDVAPAPPYKRTIGGRLPVGVAKKEIEQISNELVENEAPRIKNARVRALARQAAFLSVVPLVVYALLMLVAVPRSDTTFNRILDGLRIEPTLAANFMLLWVGTFVGVCLSYAIRKHEFKFADLTADEADYLAPETRLVLAAAFATVLTNLCILGLGNVTFGNVNIQQIGSMPLLAFVVGALMGISEQALSGKVQAQAASLFAKTN